MITSGSLDWLDESCWRCGSEQARPDEGGRLLCVPCRTEIFGSPSSEGGLAISLRLYWESHPLERCWGCMARPVDSEDDLGLCLRCRTAINAGTAKRIAQEMASGLAPAPAIRPADC